MRSEIVDGVVEHSDKFVPMNIAYIGLGSNLGDSLQVVMDAWTTLGTVPGIRLGRLSPPYRAEPVGMTGENWFINAAGELLTVLSPQELLTCLHQIEEQFGRRRDSAVAGYQDRILDMDLLLYAQKVLRAKDLQIPHPAMQDRLFVLLPMCDIAADVLHPVLGKRMKDLLAVLQAAGENPVVEKTIWPVDKGCCTVYDCSSVESVRKNPLKN